MKVRQLPPWRLPLALVAGASLFSACGERGARVTEPEGTARPGIDVLLSDSSHLVRGRRVGLITNQTGIDAAGRSSIDRLHERGDIELVALFAPEHGIRGTAAAGVGVAEGRDVDTGLPIYSLYGSIRQPTPGMLAGLDVLAFDIQDIGTRYYTYLSTMALAMRAAARVGVEFLVLDRPNPIGGTLVQGPVLDPAFSSFVGLYPIPVRHGLTAGELARLYNQRYRIGARLHVVPVQGWSRGMWFDTAGLKWVPPSPNMPSLESATHYPGTCLFEGTNLSVGRGTPTAFQQIGAPWLDGEELARRLSRYGLEGVRFEAVRFTPRSPSDGKYDGEPVSGVRFLATDRERYDPVVAGVAALLEARSLAREPRGTREGEGDDLWEWNTAHFDRLAGGGALREAIDLGVPLDAIRESWEEELSAFRTVRERFLIY